MPASYCSHLFKSTDPEPQYPGTEQRKGHPHEKDISGSRVVAKAAPYTTESQWKLLSDATQFTADIFHGQGLYSLSMNML